MTGPVAAFAEADFRGHMLQHLLIGMLAPLGLVFDENSPWLTVSACTGSPGCVHSAADVRADAAQSLSAASGVHRHFVGCERACGSPPAGEVLVATGDGYRLLQKSEP